MFFKMTGMQQFLAGDKRKPGKTLNDHNSIIFKYYKKVKYRF